MKNREKWEKAKKDLFKIWDTEEAKEAFAKTAKVIMQEMIKEGYTVKDKEQEFNDLPGKGGEVFQVTLDSNRFGKWFEPTCNFRWRRVDTKYHEPILNKPLVVMNVMKDTDIMCQCYILEQWWANITEGEGEWREVNIQNDKA